MGQFFSDPQVLAGAAQLFATRDTPLWAAASGFGSFGERVRLIRGDDGQVARVEVAGTRMVREADLAAELTGRYERT